MPESARESVPSWFADLTRQMAAGGGEDRLRGEVVSHTDCHGVLSFRVFRRGRLVRCEDLSGAVVYIAGVQTVWQRDASGTLDVSSREDDWFSIPDDFEFGARRPDADRWDGDDFTHPTGPPREVSFLGRPAWEIELAPPARKPHPMQITVDKATGLVLREGNAALGVATEWVSLEFDSELSDDLFVWHHGVDRLAPPPERIEDPH